MDRYSKLGNASFDLLHIRDGKWSAGISKNRGTMDSIRSTLRHFWAVRTLREPFWTFSFRLESFFHMQGLSQSLPEWPKCREIMRKFSCSLGRRNRQAFSRIQSRLALVPFNVVFCRALFVLRRKNINYSKTQQKNQIFSICQIFCTNCVTTLDPDDTSVLCRQRVFEL